MIYDLFAQVRYKQIVKKLMIHIVVNSPLVNSCMMLPALAGDGHPHCICNKIHDIWSELSNQCCMATKCILIWIIQ